MQQSCSCRRWQGSNPLVLLLVKNDFIISKSSPLHLWNSMHPYYHPDILSVRGGVGTPGTFNPLSAPAGGLPQEHLRRFSFHTNKSHPTDPQEGTGISLLLLCTSLSAIGRGSGGHAWRSSCKKKGQLRLCLHEDIYKSRVWQSSLYTLLKKCMSLYLSLISKTNHIVLYT